MTIWIIAAVLLLGNIWLACFLYDEHQQRLADHERSDRCIRWWRDYAGQLQREKKA